MNQSIKILEDRRDQTGERIKQLENRMCCLESDFKKSCRRWDKNWKVLLKRIDTLEKCK